MNVEQELEDGEREAKYTFHSSRKVLHRQMIVKESGVAY